MTLNLTMSCLGDIDANIPICIPIMYGSAMPEIVKRLDDMVDNIISDSISYHQFKGDIGKFAYINMPHKLPFILFGVGDGVLQNNAVEIGGKLAQTLIDNNIQECQLLLVKEACSNFACAELVLGIRMRSWRFGRYKKSMTDSSISNVSIIFENENLIHDVYNICLKYDAIFSGITFTRDLVSEPGNILYPVEFASRCKALASKNLKVSILNEDDMHKLGMGALLGVGQGSIRESQMVIMEYNGGQHSTPPIALVGKGVCFDTGGISLKAGPGMEEMIWDMAGGGVVAGTMKAISDANLPINVVGVIGLVENMPGSNAQRPGDIVTSMSGQTIDVHNTDAEGRLVLADALHYTIETFKPSQVIDLATLTGAIIISLGHEYAGLMSNDDVLANRLVQAGQATNEKLWRMPLSPVYDKQIDSSRADMKNIGGKGAGSIIAAQFLQRFVGKTPWAHLDIAGVAWSNERKPTSDKGATGFGVRLLFHYLQMQQ